MTPRRPFFGDGHRRIRLQVILGATGVALVTTVILAAFHTVPSPVTPDDPIDAASELVTNARVGIRTFEPTGDVSVDADVVYGTVGDALLTLDVCSPTSIDAEPVAPAEATDAPPADALTAAPPPTPTTAPSPGEPTPSAPAPSPGPQTPEAPALDAGTAAASTLAPAVIVIHGGSWARGDKGNGDWRAVCEWLASEGFVAYSVNYRLVPAVRFPAAIDDVSLAVEWIRQADNAAKYGIDPDRIGAFGGSAGGNLAALLGARGSGSLTEGSRIAAVAELSGPVDLSYAGLVETDAPAGLQQISLDFLGCESLRECDAANKASVASHLDPTDPPVFIGASAEEFIPFAQSIRYAQQLKKLGIQHELAAVPGTLHSIGILDARMRDRVAAFLHTALDE